MVNLIKAFIKNPLMILILTALTLFYVFAFISIYTLNVVIDIRKEGGKSATKFVLYWTSFWTVGDYQLGYGFEPFKNCEYSNCFVTDKRTLMRLEEYDALVFHATYNNKTHGIPWIRSSHQRYIFMNGEAPVYLCPNLKHYAAYFNWTMSYRFDSDIVRRHGYIFKEKTNYTMPSEQVLKKKTNLAAWFVSNCHTRSHRENLGKEIKQFMPLDVYGACGKLQCPNKEGDENISPPECYNMIEKKYKFYFSFENSFCTDYTTENLYNILGKDLVPVVYGGGDYRLSAPPNSVINVEDFESVEKLADYLKYLDQNNKEYLKYFEWKKEYRISTSLESSACQMCQKLHEPLKQSIYYDLHEWWWGKNKSMCRISKALPKIVSDLLPE